MDKLIWFDKYEIIKKIGSGGCGEVFLVKHIALNGLRAIKRISKQHDNYRELLREAHILQELTHPFIPTIYDFYEDSEFTYIVMQYMEGDSLYQYRKKSIKTSMSQILDFGIQICDLLQYLYSVKRPILYLDLKPHNIIVYENELKLIDFGTAAFKDNLHKRECSMGTKGYASPELFTKYTPDERADIYGVGTILFFLLTGNYYDGKTQLFTAYSSESRWKKELYYVIRRCLAYHPALRYNSVTTVKSKLLKISNRNNSNSKERTIHSVTIGLAGSQQRIGVSHLSFMITSFYEQKGVSSLYVENNDTGHILSIIKYLETVKIQNEVFHIHNCNMVQKEVLDKVNTDNFFVIVKDYGKLTEDNLTEFLLSNVKFLVMGAKEWELMESERTLNLVKENSDIKYIFNYLSGESYNLVTKNMGKLSSYRIPYEPEPFAKMKSKHSKDFLSKILEE
jgi:serine/threonine protein kinase